MSVYAACEGQARYVVGWGLHGVVGEIPVFMLVGAYEKQTGVNSGCAKMGPLELGEQGAQEGKG